LRERERGRERDSDERRRGRFVRDRERVVREGEADL